MGKCIMLSTLALSCAVNLVHLDYRENRYLLFLTENYAALGIFQRYLQDIVGKHGDGAVEVTKPFVLFGSSFPKDVKYTQVNG